MSASIELRNKRVLVIGLARTGVATALFCAARGARVTATDTRTEKDLGDTIAPLRRAGVGLELGGHREEWPLLGETGAECQGHPLASLHRGDHRYGVETPFAAVADALLGHELRRLDLVSV